MFFELIDFTESFVQAGQESANSGSSKISSAAVLGNIFVFIMAGYETSANTLTYAILQADLDAILGSRPISQWSFDADFPRILNGYVGATMNETLRLYTVLPFFPKTTRETPKTFSTNGRDYTVPADTLILMNTSATHRNPKYCPAAIATGKDGPPYPVSSFDPSRWLSKDKATSAFSPTPGSYIPFSDGPRACMGKRFAQAQFCAVIAALFKDYSVELAIDDSEAAKESSGRGLRQSLWDDARRKAEQELSTGVGFFLSLKMNGRVPLRLVKRGEEEFEL